MAPSETFKNVKLRYVGKRFNNARLPLEVLGDLPAFRELVLHFARDRWKKSNSHRSRLPKGFDKALSFDLVEIRDGSAIPVIAWTPPETPQPSFDFGDDYQSIIENALNDTANFFDEKNVHDVNLKPHLIRTLNKFGASLKDDEHIEFVQFLGKDNKVISLDAEKRKRILKSGSEFYEVLFSGTGTLNGTNINGYIFIDTDEYKEIKIDGIEPERITDEFDGNIDGQVEFKLIIELDKTDCFKKVKQVVELELVEQFENISPHDERLREIASLKQGWRDGEGEETSEISSQIARKIVSETCLPQEHLLIFSNHEGGMLLEFEYADWDYTVEVLRDGNIEFYGVELKGDSEMSHDFSDFEIFKETLKERING